jgi:hypothetical protein
MERWTIALMERIDYAYNFAKPIVVTNYKLYVWGDNIELPLSSQVNADDSKPCKMIEAYK